ncbi:MAG TPA: GMC family oxidoreductase N-terminal domain-containing protein [Thermoplasmata archaeon]|nr:GMC family oxidoreductase N-terminal domain-containing protein [Thermoplasmata archaeon]
MATSPALTALVDSLLPASGEPGPGSPYPAASEVGVDRDVAEMVDGLPVTERAEFATLLRAVESRGINFLLSGRAVRFTRLTPAQREAYLQGMSRSRLALKRKGFHAVKRLAAGLYFSRPTTGEGHPLWERIHYQPPPLPGDVPDPLAGVSPVRPDHDVEEVADLCVVGSGAGGSVIASRVAAAGYRVVVLEAGGWFAGLRYPRSEQEAHDRLFVGRGILTNSDHSIGILSGEAVGGGTAINWMTCLPPRPEARAEWAHEAGMLGSDGPEFDRAYRAVSERLHVSTTESDVNPSNDALRRGCLALGYRQGVDWDIIARNAVGCRSRCGFCTFGCPYAARQGTLTTFLADAFSRGARLYASTRAETVDVERGRATGVQAVYREGGRACRVRVRARAVVVAGGALQTPALLLRSGVRFAGVGAGLRLDPTTALAAEFASEVRTWEGPHQTVGVYRFQSTDAGAHGPWIEVAPTHPGLAAIALPWEGAAPFRRQIERLERVATPIVLVRDVGEGRVTIDREGRPAFHYALTRRDRQNLVRGMVETARILQAAGAVRISSLHTPQVEVGDGTRSVSPAALDRFIAEVQSRGIVPNAVALFSAHPMGSARAGTDPRRSAARATGEVHGVDGLWIGDGSLLPSAPGANPMMSILALAWRTSDALLARLGGTPSTGAASG